MKSQLGLYSDGSLIVTTSAQNPNFKVNFKDMFPYEYNRCIKNMKYYQNNHFCSIR